MTNKKQLYEALLQVMTGGDLLQETGSAFGSMVISVPFRYWAIAHELLGKYQREKGIISDGEITIKGVQKAG